MKAFSSLLAASLIACGSSTNNADGGSQDQDAGPDGGVMYPSSINVGFDVINVHPAAAAALTGKALTIPDINNFILVLQPLVGATDGGAVLGPGKQATINVLGVNFTDFNTTTAIYGLVASIQQMEPDTGFPTCGQVHSTADGGPTADAGTGAIVDWFVPVFQHVGPFSQPTGDLVHQAAYAVPASYISLLDCAAGRAPGSMLNKHGAILTYTSVQPDGKGGAIGSISMSDPNGDSFLYYSDDYSQSGATNFPGSHLGVATLAGVPGNGIVVISASDTSGSIYVPQTVWAPSAGLSTVFFSPQ